MLLKYDSCYNICYLFLCFSAGTARKTHSRDENCGVTECSESLFRSFIRRVGFRKDVADDNGYDKGKACGNPGEVHAAYAAQRGLSLIHI